MLTQSPIPVKEQFQSAKQPMCLPPSAFGEHFDAVYEIAGGLVNTAALSESEKQAWKATRKAVQASLVYTLCKSPTARHEAAKLIELAKERKFEQSEDPLTVAENKKLGWVLKIAAIAASIRFLTKKGYSVTVPDWEEAVSGSFDFLVNGAPVRIQIEKHRPNTYWFTLIANQTFADFSAYFNRKQNVDRRFLNGADETVKALGIYPTILIVARARISNTAKELTLSENQKF